MLPIRELLNRIRWDREFAKASFEIAYLDRLENRIIHVSLASVRFQSGNSFSFQLDDESGEPVSIPLHRIREVYRDGVSIWRRPDR